MKRFIISIILLLVFANTAYAAEFADANPADFANKKIGVNAGSFQEKWATEDFKESEIVYFSSYPDGILAVETGKIDAMFFSDLPLRYAIGERSGFDILMAGSKEIRVAPIFPKNEKGDRLREQFNVKNGAFAETTAIDHSESQSGLPKADITEFYGKRIGVQSGSTEEAEALKLFKDPQLYYYMQCMDAVVALQTNKIDAYYADDIPNRYAASAAKDLMVLDIGGKEIMSAPIFQKTERGKLLRSQYNEFLKEYKQSGKLEEITKKWVDGPEEKRVMDTSELPDINGTVIIGTEIGYAPQEYIKDGKLVGLEAELLREFCKKYGYRPEFCNATFDALVMGVYTGKFDIGASALTITEERAKSVDFGDPFLICHPSLLVRKDGGWTGTPVNEKDDVNKDNSGITGGFYRTFIEESRWKLFLDGIGVTFLITILSVLFGTAAGFAIYLLCRNGNRAANAIVNGINWLVTGMPLVVFLMVLFYIVFAKSDLSGTTVAIIGFSIVFALTTFHLLKLGEDAIDFGQKEAAYALGYNDIDAFIRIILPQAAKHFLPSYQGEVVSLIKATAVVGYITVMDITKIGDVVRGRTYDAVFPLLAVVVAYFLLSAIFKAAIKIVIKKADTKNRPKSKIMKGVEIR